MEAPIGGGAGGGAAEGPPEGTGKRLARSRNPRAIITKSLRAQEDSNFRPPAS